MQNQHGFVAICIIFVLMGFQAVNAQHTIQFYTAGQRYGVADLDCFWISPTKDVSDTLAIKYQCESPDSQTVGKVIWRSGASNYCVWGQFGCFSDSPYNAKAGSVWFKNLNFEGTVYLKVRYSKYSASTVPIEIYLDGKTIGSFQPLNQGSWTNYGESDWIEIKHTPKMLSFYTKGQSYGTADLDCFWLSKTGDMSNAIEYQCENPDTQTVGESIWRSAARKLRVHGQFGCRGYSPYSAKSGLIGFKNLPFEGKVYIKIRYSKYSRSSVPIEIHINGEKQNSFVPNNMGDWNRFTETGWIPIDFTSEFAKASPDNPGIQAQRPEGFRLSQNYPNPFNPQTTINYSLPKNCHVELIIFNLQGQEIRRLVSEFQSAGDFNVVWDGQTQSGLPVASGTYFYQIRVKSPEVGPAEFTEIKKMHLIK